MASDSSARRRQLVGPRHAARRTAAAGMAGSAALAIAWAVGAAWPAAFLMAWDVAAAVYLVWIWSSVGRLDGSRAQRIAASEDDSRAAGEAVLLGASLATLAAVGFALAEAGRAESAPRAALTALAVLSVLLAWAVVNTIFALRYARLFYAPPVGGLGFGEDDPPGYA